jgi:hypothetical protein
MPRGRHAAAACGSPSERLVSSAGTRKAVAFPARLHIPYERPLNRPPETQQSTRFIPLRKVNAV